jgi:rod shape-determining protein MreC
MRWISPLLSKQRAFRTSIILTSISLACFLLPTDAKELVAKYLNVFYVPFYGISDRIGDLREVYEINSELKATIAAQMYRLSVLQEQSKENERLRTLLGFAEQVEYDVVPAEIVELDPKRRQNAVRAEVEHGDSSLVHRPVISVDGLVGKTTSIAGSFVTVELLTSPNCPAAARDANTRVLGIIRWKGGKDLILDNVSLADSVAVGDTVVTSGLGGIFIQDIPIGIVSEVENGGSPFFKSIAVKSFVDFSALDELIILKESAASR